MSDTGEDFLADMAPERDKPCPCPTCAVSLETNTERRRHLQKQHDMTFREAMDLLDGMGIDEWEVDPDTQQEGGHDGA
jgi:hypothetical protein